MKKTVLLINHSRGAVVNEKALVRALREGGIGGYGMDVYEHEPPDPTGEPFRFRNVVVSPHLGGGTREARARANRMVAEDVVRVIRGEIPENLVNRGSSAGGYCRREFVNHAPFARWTFFDPAPPRSAAKTKLALTRSNSRLCGRCAAGAEGPEKSPMRAPGT